MARRKTTKRNKSILETAINEDWKFSLVISGIVFAIASSISYVYQNTVFSLASLLLQKIGYLIGSMFLAISVFKRVVLLFKATKTCRNYRSNTLTIEPRPQQALDIDFKKNEQATIHSEAPVFSDNREWSLKLIRELEWKLFEDLCVNIYIQQGFNAVPTGFGGDGGIDIKLYKVATDIPFAIVQCKSWSQKVGVKPIRELIGVMKHECVSTGFYATTSDFTSEAEILAKQNGVILVNGSTILSMIKTLNQDAQNTLFSDVVKKDYKTPTCASCGVKMIRRKSTKGEFWGCIHYPRCRQTLKLRLTDTEEINTPKYWQY